MILPLLHARSFGVVRQGQTDETSLVAHQNPEFVIQPRWWVEAQVAAKTVCGSLPPVFLCYKDLTSPTNERTMIAAFIPAAGVVNSAPLILCDAELDYRTRCGLLAILNSFILDFVARQKVGNVHLNFFIVEQLPILPPPPTPTPSAAPGTHARRSNAGSPTAS